MKFAIIALVPFCLVSCKQSDEEILRIEKLKERAKIQAQMEVAQETLQANQAKIDLDKEMEEFIKIRAKPLKDEAEATIAKFKQLPSNEDTLAEFEKYSEDHRRRSKIAHANIKAEWDRLHPNHPMPPMDDPR